MLIPTVQKPAAWTQHAQDLAYCLLPTIDEVKHMDGDNSIKRSIVEGQRCHISHYQPQGVTFDVLYKAPHDWHPGDIFIWKCSPCLLIFLPAVFSHLHFQVLNHLLRNIDSRISASQRSQRK